jgi:hypothetical protein
VKVTGIIDSSSCLCILHATTLVNRRYWYISTPPTPLAQPSPLSLSLAQQHIALVVMASRALSASVLVVLCLSISVAFVSCSIATDTLDRFTATWDHQTTTTFTGSTITGAVYVSFNRVLFADSTLHRIYTANVFGASPVTFAGTGVAGSSSSGVLATSANVNQPTGGAVANGFYYFVEKAGHCARKVSLSTQILTTVAGVCGTAGSSGDGGSPLVALLNTPTSIAVDATGRVFIADSANKRIRMISADGSIITSLLDFTAENITPIAVAWDFEATMLYWASSNALGRANLAGSATSFPAPPSVTFTGISAVPGVGNMMVVSTTGALMYVIDVRHAFEAAALVNVEFASVTAGSMSISVVPGAVILGRSGAIEVRYNSGTFYHAKLALRPLATNVLVRFKANSTASFGKALTPEFVYTGPCMLGLDTAAPSVSACATLTSPSKLINRATDYVFADAGLHCVKSVTTSLTVASVFGNCGTAGSSATTLSSPSSVAFDSNSSELVIADNGNSRLMRISSAAAFVNQTAYPSGLQITDLVLPYSGGSRLFFVGRNTNTNAAVFGMFYTATSNWTIISSTSPPSLTAAASGQLSALQLESPVSIAHVPDQHRQYTFLIADARLGAIQVELTDDFSTGTFKVFMGLVGATWNKIQVSGNSTDNFSQVVAHPLGVFLVETTSGSVLELPAIRAAGIADVQRVETMLNKVALFRSVALDRFTSSLYARLHIGGTSQLFKFPNRGGAEQLITAASGTISNFESVAVDESNGDVYYVDYARHCVQKYSPGAGTVTTAAGTCGSTGTASAGDGGRPDAATLYKPTVIKRMQGTSPKVFMLIDEDSGRVRVLDFNVQTINTFGNIFTATAYRILDAAWNPVGNYFLAEVVPSTMATTTSLVVLKSTTNSTIITTNYANLDSFTPSAASSALSGYRFTIGGPIEWISGDMFQVADGPKIVTISLSATLVVAGSTYSTLQGVSNFQAGTGTSANYGLVSDFSAARAKSDYPAYTFNPDNGAFQNFDQDTYGKYIGSSYQMLMYTNKFVCSIGAPPTCSPSYMCEVGLYGGSPLVPAITNQPLRAAGTELHTSTFDGVASSEMILTNVVFATTSIVLNSPTGEWTYATYAPVIGSQSNCQRVTLKFAPRCFGTFDATLTINYVSSYNASTGTLVYSLRGYAHAPVHRVFNDAFPAFAIGSGASPSVMVGTDMGFVTAGATTTVKFSSQNYGDRILTLRIPVLTQTLPTGATGTPFALTTTPTQTSLVRLTDISTNPTARQNYTLTFTAPSVCGVYSATVNITNDDCTKVQSLNFQVTVGSTAAPTITGCPTAAVALAAITDRCFATYPLSLSSTYCGQPLAVTGPVPAAPGNNFPVGNTSYVYTATTPSGNSTQCTVQIAVTDTQPPKVQCPANIIVSSCFSVVRYLPPLATDNCAATVAQTAGLPSGSTFPVGSTTNTFTATDTVGLTSNCSFIVTVTSATCTAGGLDPSIDYDGDGLTAAEGDCCESTDQCRDPYTVNAGAAEIPGNGIDDNCNGQIDENRNCDRLLSEQRFSTLTIANIESFPRALGLCERVDDDGDRSSGYIYYSPLHPRITLADGFVGTKPSPLQVALLRSFGAITAIHGNGIVLSTGAARMNGEIGKTGVDMVIGTVSDPPPAWPTAPTSIQLPFAPGCGLVQNRAYDSVRFRLNLRMPTNFRGFAVRFLFGAEQPDGHYPPSNLCQPQKDFFLVLTNAKSAPPGGNIAVDANRDYISTLNPDPLFWARCRQYSALGSCTEGPFSLTNTGYDGASGWMTVGANAEPGKVIYMDFVLFDGGDGLRDSFVFIDEVFYTAEESTLPAYGPRFYSDLAISSLRAPSFVLTTSATPSATIQYSFRNQGLQPASDIFLSFTPPRGTSFVSATVGQTPLQCTTLGGSTAATSTKLYRCAIGQSLQGRGVLSGQIVLNLTQGIQGSMIVRVTVSSSSIDQDLGNNARSVTFSARA